jgi:hypothetical protein
MTDLLARLQAALGDHYTVERELGAGGEPSREHQQVPLQLRRAPWGHLGCGTMRMYGRGAFQPFG